MLYLAIDRIHIKMTRSLQVGGFVSVGANVNLRNSSNNSCPYFEEKQSIDSFAQFPTTEQAT